MTLPPEPTGAGIRNLTSYIWSVVKIKLINHSWIKNTQEYWKINNIYARWKRYKRLDMQNPPQGNTTVGHSTCKTRAGLETQYQSTTHLSDLIPICQTMSMILRANSK